MAGSPRPEFHVPGAYHFDNPLPYAIPTTRALGADVFRPPVASSPADSTYLDLARSAGSLYSDVSSVADHVADHGAKRKRATQDSRESTPLAEWDANATNGQHGGRRLYTLAGQIDIHGAPGLQDAMDESVYSDVEYRRALGPHDATAAAEKVANDAQSDADRWRVLHALGNVVGKVWEFCTTGAFRGFHAGDGAGYDWETGKPTEVGGKTPTGSEGGVGGSDLPLQNEKHRDELTPAPNPTHDDRDHDHETTPQRNGKRRQVSAAGDELGRNWVIVDPKLKQRQSQPHAQTPRRSTAQGQGLGQKTPLRNGRASASATPAAANTRTSDRRAPSYTRGSTTTTVTPSTAASRRINTPISRMDGAAAHGRRGASAASAARVSHAGSPSWSSREPASFASPRSSTSVAGAVAASPRRPYAASSYNSPGGSRIPLPQPGGADAGYNPFSRAAATASPRPGSRAGGRSSSMAVGATGSPSQNGHGHGHAHRRSYSGRVGMSPLPKQTSAGLAAGLDADTSLGLTESPRLNDEAKRLAAQNLAAEQESDAKMEAFNFRLQQMIRQGQEALGTTFEVDGDDGGGGGAGVDDYWADD